GSGVMWIALLVAGLSLALRFSWLHVAERIGSALERLQARREAQREVKRDLRLGEAATHERERVAEEVRHDHPAEPVPLVIERQVVEVPKSERTAKEQQKP